MNAHLPHAVRLPFGYTITVKAVGPRKLKIVAQGNVHGCWDVETRTIWIDKTLEKEMQVYTFSHELFHAVTDYQHFLMQKTQTPPG